METFGPVKLQSLFSERGVWADTDLHLRSVNDLVPHVALEKKKYVCSDRGLECLLVQNISFYFHDTRQLSDVSICYLSQACFVFNEYNVSYTWNVVSSNGFSKEKWGNIFSRLLDITLVPDLSLPKLSYQFLEGNVCILLFKPITWVLTGIYQSQEGYGTTSNFFQAEFPLTFKTHLNGILEVADLCAEDPIYFNLSSDRTSKLMIAKDFFCRNLVK
ncbi:hypothetical protein DSO57_1012412 [Entomophthora muscae]|uniref:Uncharacterized protein n=1 Tax=Entomophthora muscae TaxID=34485 RepID=A0ACC2URD6_9FUNG|nr:hypothetical protein DSO57_1012412 [Entomophthora muscae]